MFGKFSGHQILYAPRSGSIVNISDDAMVEIYHQKCSKIPLQDDENINYNLFGMYLQYDPNRPVPTEIREQWESMFSSRSTCAVPKDRKWALCMALPTDFNSLADYFVGFVVNPEMPKCIITNPIDKIETPLIDTADLWKLDILDDETPWGKTKIDYMGGSVGMLQRKFQFFSPIQDDKRWVTKHFNEIPVPFNIDVITVFN